MRRMGAALKLSLLISSSTCTLNEVELPLISSCIASVSYLFSSSIERCVVSVGMIDTREAPNKRCMFKYG